MFKKKEKTYSQLITDALDTLNSIVSNLEKGIELGKSKINANKLQIDALHDENLKVEEQLSQADKAKSNIKNLLG